MKTIRLMILLQVLAITGLVPLKPSLAQQNRPGKILHDFRVQQKSNSAPLSQAAQQSVLSKVFRKYLTDENECNRQFVSSDSDTLRAARNAGQIVPTIADSISGSFTASGQNQTAYVISVGECNASHAENFGSKRVAIFGSGRLLADFDVDFKNNIILKTDLNSDGIDELLMTSGDMNQGTLTETAALVDFQNGRFKVIQDLGTVVEDACASAIPGSTSRASVVAIVSAQPFRVPKLRVDNYETGCGKVKRWRLVPAGK
jgi:hypothetical protein